MVRKSVALGKSIVLMIVLLVTAVSAIAQTTYFSRSPGGNWNSSTTWSTVAFDDPTNTGTFPVAGDIVFIGGTGSIVTISGPDATFNAACASVSIADNSTLDVGRGITVSGTTTVGSGTSGVLTITSTVGTKFFIGEVIINSNGLWNETANSAVVFRGGITNFGTFSAGTGVHNFNTNSQALSGTSTFSIPNIFVNGAAVVLTNTNTLTVNNGLSGTGRLTQGEGAILNIGGTSTITNMTATAAGNTVNYTGSAQTVKDVAYQNLTLSGSGVKTLQVATTDITGDLTISGTSSATAVVGLTIGGDVTLSGGSFTAGAFTHNVGGDWINNGSFTGTGSVINLNGTAQNISGSTTTFNDLQLSGSGTKTFSVSTTISNELSIGSGAIADLSNANTYTSNTLTLAGALQGSGTWGNVGSGAANENGTFFSGNGLITVAAGGFTYYSIASADWSAPTTWSTTGFGGAPASQAPGTGDYVIIGNGQDVTVTGAELCDVLLFDANTESTLSINTGSLTIGTSLTIPQSTSASNTLSIAGGTLISPNLAFTAGGGAGHQVTISTGTANISGAVTGIGASSTIEFIGTGLLQVGGAMFTAATGTLTSPSGTVEYNGAAQTIESFSYNNLTLSGSGNKTLAATTTIGGDLVVGDNTTFVVGAVILTVTGTTTVGGGTSGILSITSTTGTKTFTGLVTIAANGTWSNTSEAVTFRGGITNNGTFNAGTGTQTFSAVQTLNGTLTIPTMSVNGVGAFAVTNNGTLTVTTNLSGIDQLAQGVGAVLNIAGASTITTLSATANNNTVNFSGGVQTINNNNYFNLTLSGSGVKTLQTGTTAITGDLTISGTADATAVVGLTIGGDLDIGSGTTFTTGAFMHNVGGDWINNGTFTGTGSIINLNGGAQNISGVTTTFDDLQLSGIGTKTFSVSTTISDELSIDNGAIASLSNANIYTSNTLILAGALQGSGTWGSSSSAADNDNDTFFSGNGLITVATGGFTYYSIASADWSAPTTWSTTGFGGAPASQAPGTGDYVIIGNGQDVTVTGVELCDVLLFDANTEGTLSINSGSLTIGTSLTIPQSTSASNTLSLSGGNLIAPSLAFTAGGGAGHQVSIATGTATISGDIMGIGASSTIQFTGAGLLQVGGSMFTSSTGTLTAPSGTVEYNGSAQTIQALPYFNLTLSGSGDKTMAATTTINGDLAVVDNTNFIVGAVTLVVTGTTTVGDLTTNGTLSITSNTGTKTFTGMVTISPNGTWSNATEAVTFRGGITNDNGTFNAGTGTQTFNAAQSLSGTLTIPTMSVTGAGAFAVTNNGNLTVTTSLQGTDQLAQGSDAVLTIEGASTITTLNATASGNTVNFSGGAQTINNNAYVNLTLSGSGVKTLQVGTTSITGDLTISGTASATAVADLTIGGDVIIGVGTGLTAGAFTHNVGGNWSNNGTFAGTGSTINLNGGAQNISGGTTIFDNLELSGSGTKTFGVSTTVSNELAIANGAIADLSNANTYTANLLALAGPIQASGTWGSTSSAPPATNQNDIFFSGTGLITVFSTADNFFSIADAPWSSPTTWSNSGFGGAPAASVPGPGDYVFIGSNSGSRLISINSIESCEAITFDEGQDADNTLILLPGGDLMVTGAITLQRKSFASRTNRIVVGSQNLTAGSIDFVGADIGNHEIDISTGTVTISGDITGVGASSTIIFSGAGLLEVGGSFFAGSSGTLTAPSGTVEYNGSAQTIQALPYFNLTLSGSGDKTLAATTTINGDLVVGDNTNFIVGAVSLTVSGTTTVGGGTSGTLSITSTAGTKLFIDLVTINVGGLWNETVNETMVFRGGITNFGTFTAGTGAHTFNTNSQVLTGIFSIPSVTITGAAVVLTNTNTLTVNNALSGSGRLTQGAGATLNIGGASTINNLTATAIGNTVNFLGAAQTINNVAYENLNLSGSGVKTLQAGTSLIAGNLTLIGTVSTTPAANLTIVGALDIGSGTEFTAGAFDHIIGGNWINDGTFNHSNRRITFSGTSTQNIQGTASTTFFDLNIAEGPGDPDVQLDQTAGVNLEGEMTFDSDATFDADGPGGNQIFTLISTASGDGRIGPLGGSADLTGAVTVQRYMDAEGKIYRYISTPVDNPTAEDLQGEIPITGPFTGSSFPPQTGCTNCAPCTGCVLNNQSMFQYDETIVAGLNNRYAPFPSAANSETMIPGRGYSVYVRNDLTPTIWNLRAPINSGEVDLNPSITGSNDGFNLVGNPYPSPIDWESASWIRSNIDPTFYIWDNSINNYASYGLGATNITNGGSRYIAHGQAFWVLASSGADLRTQEGVKADRASVAQATFFLNTKQVDQVRVKLVAGYASDELLIKVNHQGATLGYDARIDAFEFPSDTLLSLHAITADKKRLAVNVMGLQQEEGTEITVGLAGTKPGSYKMDFMEFENFTTPTSVYLFDRYDDVLKEIVPADKEYQFTVTDDPVSSGADRFVLFLTPAGKMPMLEKLEDANVSVYPNPTLDKVTVRVKTVQPVSVNIYNTVGTQVIETSELIRSGNQRIGQFDLSLLPSGVYIIQINNGNNLLNKRIMKQ